MSVGIHDLDAGIHDFDPRDATLDSMWDDDAA
jgi:hypothetical protein